MAKRTANVAHPGLRLRSVQVMLLAAVAAVSLAQTPAPTPPAFPQLTVQFPHPERIRYDAQSLILDNKPVFIYSGAFHYFRCPKELWKDRLTKMKDAGLNCVETYLAWNYHEPDEPAGPQDFSKLRHMADLDDFLALCREMGFYLLIRPGPYICAEWDRGGFPEWVLNHQPADFRAGGGGFLRSDHPAMLAWDRHWLEAAAKVVKPHLVTNLPPNTPGVIGWQIENEYNLCDVVPAEQASVLRALTEYSLAAGIDVPLFTCRTKTANFDAYLQAHLYDTVTCYPKYDMSILVDRIRNIAEPQPQKFRAVMELQAGWFSQLGGRLSEDMGFSDAHLNQLGLTAIEQGCTLINWYMFYGGSQFGYGAAQNMTQSYDYDAPIREPGAVGPRYLAAKAIGLMLKEHGHALIRASYSAVLSRNATHPDVHVALRFAQNGDRYYFLRSDARDQPRKGSVEVPLPYEARTITIQYDLPPFGAKILHLKSNQPPEEGEWLPKPVTGPERPTALPDRTTALALQHTAPEQWDRWRPARPNQSFASLGINDSRFVAFRSSFTLTPEQLQNPPTLFGHARGATLLFAINGRPVPPESSRAGLVSLAGLAQAGQNTVEVLYENTGNDNHYTTDTDKAAPDLRLIPPAAATPLNAWRIKIFPTIVGIIGTRLDIDADINTLDWNRVSVTNGPNLAAENATALFHHPLEVTREQLDAGVTLALGTLDETGEVLVNGRRVASNLTERLQPLACDITPFLKPGKNNVVVFAANTDHKGGLYNGAYLLPRGTPLPSLEVSSDAHGVGTAIWSQPVNAAWTAYAADAPPAGLLAWYRAEFATPAPIPNVWVPYHLHLEANVNAQVFFNGHHLGTYYGQGPQQDIYLPECWLSPPGGPPNVLAFQARRTSTTAPLVTKAEIRPYRNFAEKR
jgi:hypothetical protein